VAQLAGSPRKRRTARRRGRGAATRQQPRAQPVQATVLWYAT